MSVVTRERTTPQPPCADSQLSDEELFLQFRDQRNTHAFDALVRRYEKELFRYLYHYLRNADLADDVFQATFLNVFTKPNLFDPRRRFRPWLYSIATHVAVDALRCAGRRAAVSLDAQLKNDTTAKPADLVEAHTPSPAANAEKRERNRLIRKAVDRLPDHLRSALILVYFQGLKYKEAAEALNVPMGTLKSRVYQGIRKLEGSLPEEQRAELSPVRSKPIRARTRRSTKQPAGAVSNNPGRFAALRGELCKDELFADADVRVPAQLAQRTIRRLRE